MKLASEDLRFLCSLGRALLALAASALILLASYVAYLDWYSPEAANSADSHTIKGSQFQTVMGTTEVHGETLVLKSLQSEGSEHYALISEPFGLPAEHYPLLRYRLEGFQPGLKVQLFWRRAGSMFSAPIAGGIDGTTFANLAAQPNWRGTITDVALYITGDLRDQNLIISRVSFEPYSWQGLISAIFFEWTAFRGWTGRSINYLPGTPDAPQSETLSPTLAMAAWAGLSLVFLYAIGFALGKKGPISYGAVVLIPWLTLDQLWQSQLSIQLQETRRVFGDKSTHQKHLADLDGFIYSYSKRLKDQVLPASAARIILLASPEDRFIRLKTQYYLLPHNIYNYNSLPPPQGIRAGDYVLVLGDIPGLRYLMEEELLAWDQNSQLKANLVDTDDMGRLFHVTPVDSGVTEVPARAGRE